MNLITVLLRLGLSAVFGVAAVTKFTDQRGTRELQGKPAVVIAAQREASAEVGGRLRRRRLRRAVFRAPTRCRDESRRHLGLRRVLLRARWVAHRIRRLRRAASRRRLV